MKNAVAKVLFLSIMLGIMAASCSSGNRIGNNKNCGCDLNKGFIGY